MFCNRCGAQVNDDARFCSTCGAPITSRVPQAADAPVSAAPVPVAAPPDRKRKSPAIVAGIVAAILMTVGIAGFTAWSAFFAPYAIDVDTFPDAAVRATVSATYDTDHDGKLSRDEARAVTVIEVEGASSLSGVGRIFTNATAVSCTGGELHSLDVSDMPHIKRISAPEEPLASLDVSSNPELISLNIPSDTKVAGLDTTKLHEAWIMKGVTQTYDGSDSTSTFTTEHDDAGRLTTLAYDNGDSSFVREEFSYDDKGHLAQAIERSRYHGGDTTSTTYEVSCDEQGRVLSMVPMQSDSTSPNSYFWTYDEAGRPVRYEMRYSDGSVYGFAYTYDDEGRLVKKVQLDSDGKEDSAETYRYEGGACVAVETDSGTISYTLDQSGNVTRVEGDYDNPDVGLYNVPVDYAYDERGRLVAAKAEFAAAYADSTYTAEFTYNRRGDIESVGVDGDGLSTTFTPSYERYFVTEGAAEPYRALSIGRGVEPLTMAQHTALADVLGVTPTSAPAPEPYAMPGGILVLF